jgi:hypothetical protein
MSHSRGGETPFIQRSSKIYLACDCVCTLAPIRTREMNIKVSRRRKWTDWDAKIKIEMSVMLKLEGLSVWRR